MKKKLLFLFFLFPYLCLAQKIEIATIKNYIINPVTSEYIIRCLKKAEEEKAIFILQLDTPGGLLKSTEKIVKSFLNSSAPVVTYITPSGGRAASAGVFISYASHIIAMSPATHIGAAHPIIGGGSWGKLSKEMKDKILNDTVTWAKTIAEKRKRPINFIKNAIKKSISVTDKEAVKQKICDIVALDLNDLVKKLNGKTVVTKKGKITLKTSKTNIEKIPFKLRERVLNAIIDPNIAYLLFTLGFLGLIFEITHPGFGFPGIAGTICLLLSFYAFSILPLNYAGLALIILGIIFLIVETFTPTFGMFTLGGIIALFFGSMMLFNQPLLLKVSFKVFLPLIIFFSVVVLFIVSKAASIYRRKSKTGKDGLTGEEGIALTDIYRKGKVSIHGEIWNAYSDTKISKNAEVIVEKIKGLLLKVKERR
mgnify:CR=1 FL=1